MSRIAALLIILSLAACGMKGRLERPPGPAPEPLLGTAKNVSTPTSPQAQ
ncbi:lipoprotein [Dechloromonas sp. HYN0024]